MKKMSRVISTIFLSLFLQFNNAMAQQTLPPFKQLMVVVTDGWDNVQGTIYVYEKHEDNWFLKYCNSIVVGGKGLAIGSGLVALSIPDAPYKKEGDMKSPAGIFSMGTAFGYANYIDAKWINYPYIKATDTLICVDDMKSAAYNTLIDKKAGKVDYKSYENMLLKKDYYKWGIFINHNAPRVVPGYGSCIFMHIWENDHSGTAGCTAMKEDDLLRILHWLNNEDTPVLVQMPRKEYQKIKAQYNLPELDY